MTTIEAALYSRLSAEVTPVSGRIYPIIAPQNVVPPFLVYQRVSSRRPSAFCADTGVVQARFQITAYDDDYDGALSVRDNVRQALQRWTQTSDPLIFDTLIENEATLPWDVESRLFSAFVDVTIFYRE